MAIRGLGVDITRIERLEAAYARRGERMLMRIFTEGEREYCDARGARMTHYAARFAVKEAVMKVLGTGWGQGVRWRDIEVVRKSDAAPELELHGVSAEIARARGMQHIHITITHDAGLAVAVAVAESGS